MDGSDSKDALGDRMKAYEAVETDRAFDPSLPLVVRLDGRAFSTFTRGLDKPFDAALSKIMREVTAHLVEKNHARIGYTQSDEITLIFDRDSEETQPIFGGRAFKITSVLAGMASAKFALLAVTRWPDRVERSVPHFDGRAFSVPSRVEAVNHLVWREADASRNSVQMVAQSRFSPKQLHGKSCDDLEDMLALQGVKMEDFPTSSRFGSYLARRTFELELTGPELERIPEKHRPTGPVLRSRVVDLELAPIREKPDRVALIFGSPKAKEIS
jgi:tRNA(His) 5'-end guanylyltransferase